MSGHCLCYISKDLEIFTTCLDHNVVRSYCRGGGRKATSILSRATWLILCVREAPLWHARPSQSFFIQQVLSHNAEAEFFLDDVTVCLDLQVSFDRIIATGELTCQCETGSKAQIYTGQKHFVKSPPDGPILSVVSLNACSWSCKLQEKVKLDEFMGKQ